MYGSQEKILGQKVNVKFFTVDPYSVGTGVPRPFSKFANYWKNIFLKIKTSKIKSEKNIYQTIHNTGFIFNFFGIFTIFFVFFPIFWKFKFHFLKKLQLCSVVPAHRHMQYLGELVFFHTPLIYKEVWKNKNSPKYCIRWCAGTTESKYFLDQMKSHCITICKWPWLTLVTS